MNVAEPFALQAAHSALQIGQLTANDMRAKHPIRTLAVAFQANLFGSIDDDGHGKTVILASLLDQAFPVIWSHVRCIYNRETAPCKAFGQHVVEGVEGVMRG